MELKVVHGMVASFARPCLILSRRLIQSLMRAHRPPCCVASTHPLLPEQEWKNEDYICVAELFDGFDTHEDGTVEYDELATGLTVRVSRLPYCATNRIDTTYGTRV